MPANKHRSGPVRLLFINLYTEMGGSEYALYNLLKGLDRNSYHPIMVFNKRGPFVEKVEALGVETVLIEYQTVMLSRLLRPWVFFHTMQASARLSRFVRERTVDVIHCSDVLSLILLAPAVLRFGLPVVYSVLFSYEWSRMLALNILARLFVRRIITNSETIRQELIAKTRGLAGLVTTVYHGVDLSLFRPRLPEESNRLRRELGLPDAVKLVGMVARFDPSKGHKILLRAAASILRTRPDVRFVVVGGLMNAEVIPALRNYHREVKQLHEDLALGDRVIFLGHREDVPEVMRSLDLFVLPSVNEGFGLVVLEALASGVPAVVSRCAGVLEVVRDLDAVSVAEPGNVADFEARIEASLAGRNVVVPGSEEYGVIHEVLKALNWNVYARECERLYASFDVHAIQ